MGIEWVREECLKYPGVTEDIAWEYHVVFRIGGKMFAITSPDAGEGNFLSVKTAPEEFVEWVERPGVNPAPHVARYHWIAVEREDSVPRADIRKMLARSYDLIRGKLPKKFQSSLPVRE